MFDALANWVVFTLLNLDSTTAFSKSLHFFIMDITKIFAMLIIIIYLMGILRSFISAEKVSNYIKGKSKFTARIMAVSLGSITPFCSCSSVPLFIGFVEASIPLGITFSFLIASPMINEIAVVMLLGIVGWKVTLLYVTAGLSVAFFGGIIIEKFKPERWVESYVWDIKVGDSEAINIKQTWLTRHHFAKGEVHTIVTKIWKWVFIGLGIGAAFHGYFPTSWVDSIVNENNFIAVPMAVTLGIPLYSDAISVIPLAEAMLLKGVSIGTTLAFMMSIAAVSLPEMLILRQVIKWQGLALFFSIVAISITLVGWLFNFIL